MVKHSGTTTARTHQRTEGLKRSQMQAWSRSVLQRRQVMRAGGGVGARQFRAATHAVRAYRSGLSALDVGLEDLNHALAGSPIKAVVGDFTGSMFEIMFNRKEVETYGKLVLDVIQMGRMPGAPTTKTTVQGDRDQPSAIKKLNAKRRGILWSFSWGSNLLTPDIETVKGFHIWKDKNPYRAKWDMPFPDDRPLGFVCSAAQRSLAVRMGGGVRQGIRGGSAELRSRRPEGRRRLHRAAPPGPRGELQRLPPGHGHPDRGEPDQRVEPRCPRRL